MATPPADMAAPSPDDSADDTPATSAGSPGSPVNYDAKADRVLLVADACAEDQPPAAARVIDEGPIEVDASRVVPAVDDDDDVDSAYEERITQYTRSITSSLVNYPMEHGRRYHAFRAGVYPFPNDETEMERLDVAHALHFKMLGGRLYLAPVQEEQMHRILDMGTGTGAWAIDMGDLLPGAEVIGNDLSAIQPAWVPPNVKFELDDVESEWVHTSKFDFIFARYLCCAILDWPKLVGTVYDNLQPGGWAEFQDYDLSYYSIDGSLTEDHFTSRWSRCFHEAATRAGREPCPGPRLERWVLDAGFANVVHQTFKLPVGSWAADPAKKDLGMHNLQMILCGLEGFTLKLFCGMLGWSEQEVHVLLARVRRELRNQEFCSYLEFHVVYGQKPA